MCKQLKFDYYFVLKGKLIVLEKNLLLNTSVNIVSLITNRANRAEAGLRSRKQTIFAMETAFKENNFKLPNLALLL